MGDIGTDGVAKHIEIAGFQEDVVKVEVRIIHQALLGLLWFVRILVPQHEVDIFQGNLVDHNGYRRRFLFFRRVAWESLGKKREIELVLALVLDHVGLNMAQFHMRKMDFALQKVANADLGFQSANTCQVVVSQVFDRNIFDKDTKIRSHHQIADFDVGTRFFRKVTSSKTHCKLLNDRVLYGNEKTCDDGQHHHN